MVSAFHRLVRKGPYLDARHHKLKSVMAAPPCSICKWPSFTGRHWHQPRSSSYQPGFPPGHGPPGRGTAHSACLACTGSTTRVARSASRR